MKGFDDQTEAAARDQAIANLEAYRAEIILAARSIAVRIAGRRGSVTSTEVLEGLRDAGHNPESIDKRFMGAVFRRGWKRVGMKPIGSHKRLVSEWALMPGFFGITSEI